MIYKFNRYVKGIKMAEGASVEANSKEEALNKAKDLFRNENNFQYTILKFRDDEE